MTWVVALAIVAGAVVWLRESSADGRRRPLQQAALESEAVRHYYAQALTMARILDRIERDEMMAVTIPTELRTEIRRLVESFFGEGDERAGLR